MSTPYSIEHQGYRRHRLWLGVVWLAALAGLPLQGCLYDPDQPCDEGMVLYGDGLRCVCAEGLVYTPTGCVACGDHEVATPGGCVCEDGYSKPTADAACQETPSGLGVSCNPAAPACAPEYAHCEPSAGGGYCTTAGCTSSDECEGGYACNAESICERPPLGLGQACETPDDCAGTEATFCDSFMTHSCQVQGCSLSSDDCFSGFECCDLSAFGLPEPLCVPEGACAQ